MSKMSQLNAELSEQAYELGYLTLDQALADGYEVDYRNNKLVRVDGREQAHEEWLKEKEEILKGLHDLALEYSYMIDAGDKEAVTKRNIIENTIDFIERGEM